MSECIIPRRLLRPCSIIKSIGEEAQEAEKDVTRTLRLVSMLIAGATARGFSPLALNVSAGTARFRQLSGAIQKTNARCEPFLGLPKAEIRIEQKLS
jgi:hypothetical protein